MMKDGDTNKLQVVEETIIVDGYGAIKMPVALSEEVNVDLQDVEEIDIVDDYGVNRMPIVLCKEVD